MPAVRHMLRLSQSAAHLQNPGWQSVRDPQCCARVSTRARRVQLRKITYTFGVTLLLEIVARTRSAGVS